MDVSSATLEDLIARLFIARTDVKAYQAGPGPYLGQYFTHTQGSRENPTYLPWTRAAIQEHLAGTATYGHYLLSQENKCKLFAFDIDINKECMLPTLPMPDWQAVEETVRWWEDSFKVQDGRAAWLNRAHPARDYIKLAMRSLAHVLERVIQDKLKVPTLVTYTGAKGLHVYGFTGLLPAKFVREAAMMVIESLPIVPVRGKMIYAWDSTQRPEEEPFKDHEIFTIEVFPKQDEISNEGGFGNLMRLPLGRNQKSTDPTFIVDTAISYEGTVTSLGMLKPTDPLAAMRRVASQVNG